MTWFCILRFLVLLFCDLVGRNRKTAEQLNVKCKSWDLLFSAGRLGAGPIAHLRATEVSKKVFLTMLRTFAPILGADVRLRDGETAGTGPERGCPGRLHTSVVISTAMATATPTTTNQNRSACLFMSFILSATLVPSLKTLQSAKFKGRGVRSRTVPLSVSYTKNLCGRPWLPVEP